MLTGVFNDLRAAYPEAKLVFFTGENNYKCATLIKSIDKVIPLPIKKPAKLFRLINQFSFDVFLDFGPWPRINSLISYLVEAQFKAGFRTPGQYRHYIYDFIVDHSSDCHEFENYRNLARTLNVIPKHLPHIDVGHSTVDVLQKYNIAHNCVAMHLWPGGIKSHLKEWPLDRWLRLAEKLAISGYRIMLTGGPPDRLKNEAFVKRLDPSYRQSVINVANSDIRETAMILSLMRLVVSVNTGVMHIASALNVPLIVLNGPTSSTRWGPLSPNSINVNAPLAGCGYLNLGFEYQDSLRCMESISYEQVIFAYRQVLRG